MQKEKSFLKIKMQNICPKHLEKVKKDLGEERAKEYVARGETILDDLCVVCLLSLILVYVILLKKFEYIVAIISLTIVAVVPLPSKIIKFSRDFYDVPVVHTIWRNVSLITITSYSVLITSYCASAAVFLYRAVKPSEIQEEVVTEQCDSQSFTKEPEKIVKAETIDFPVTGISFEKPKSCIKAVWEERNRNISKVMFHFEEFTINVEVKTVYTSEDASIKEYKESFCSRMSRNLSEKDLKKLGLYTINGHDYLAAVGHDIADNSRVLIRYESIYKGAHMLVESIIPSCSNTTYGVAVVEDIINSTKYYEPDMSWGFNYNITR